MEMTKRRVAAMARVAEPGSRIKEVDWKFPKLTHGDRMFAYSTIERLDNPFFNDDIECLTKLPIVVVIFSPVGKGHFSPIKFLSLSIVFTLLPNDIDKAVKSPAKLLKFLLVISVHTLSRVELNEIIDPNKSTVLLILAAI